MKKTLGGAMFTRNCIKLDYCFLESLACLLDLCDEVCVCDVGSSDGTLEKLKELESGNKKLIVVGLSEDTWIEDQKLGKVRIAKYQNLAKSLLDTDYYIVLQADEVLHEGSFNYIRRKLDDPNRAEAFSLTRYNFWQDADHILVVPEIRQPCSTSVVRIAIRQCDSIDDGESIGADYIKHLPAAPIYHMGFVRKKEVMKEKVISIQEETFQLGMHDPKLDGIDYFDSQRWFSGDDLAEFSGPLPKYLTEWVKSRP